MTDASEEWGEVEDRFGDLALKLKYHFEQAVGRPATDEGLVEAVRQVGDALKGTVEAVGGVVRDPAVRDDAKEVGTALIDALVATVNELGEAARDALDRDDGDGDD